MWVLTRWQGTSHVIHGRGLTSSGVKAGPRPDVNVTDSERMLCNTLRCIVWHILTAATWLDTGATGMALVSISATVRDWHAIYIQQFRLFSMAYLDSCHVIWHWGWIGCHYVMPLTGVLGWPTFYTSQREHTCSVWHDGKDFTSSPPMWHIILKWFRACPVPWGCLYMFNV